MDEVLVLYGQYIRSICAVPIVLYRNYRTNIMLLKQLNFLILFKFVCIFLFFLDDEADQKYETNLNKYRISLKGANKVDIYTRLGRRYRMKLFLYQSQQYRGN